MSASKKRDVYVIGVKTPMALHAECIDKVRPDDSMSDLDVMQWSLRRRVDAMTKTREDCDTLIAFALRHGSSPEYVDAVVKVLASFESGDRNVALNGLRNVLLGTDVPRFVFEGGRIETASDDYSTEPVINETPRSLLVQTHGNCFVHAAVNCALNCPPLTRLLVEELAAARAEDDEYYDIDALLDEFRDMFASGGGADQIVARFRSKDKREFQATRRAILLGILTLSPMSAKMSPDLEQLYDAMAVTRRQAQKRKPLAAYTEGGSQDAVLARMLATAGAALDFYGTATCNDGCFPSTCVGTFKSGARVFLDRRDGLPKPGEAGMMAATFGEEGHAVAFLPGESGIVVVNSNLESPVSVLEDEGVHDAVVKGLVEGRDYQGGMDPEFHRTRVYVSCAQKGGGLELASRSNAVAARDRPYHAVAPRIFGTATAVNVDEVPVWSSQDDLVLEEVLELGQLAVILAGVRGKFVQSGGTRATRVAVQIALAAIVVLASVLA